LSASICNVGSTARADPSTTFPLPYLTAAQGILLNWPEGITSICVLWMIIIANGPTWTVTPRQTEGRAEPNFIFSLITVKVGFKTVSIGRMADQRCSLMPISRFACRSKPLSACRYCKREKGQASLLTVANFDLTGSHDKRCSVGINYWLSRFPAKLDHYCFAAQKPYQSGPAGTDEATFIGLDYQSDGITNSCEGQCCRSGLWHPKVQSHQG
jgi:hypothetical protein